MNSVAMALAGLTIAAIVFSLTNPSRLLGLYIITRPVIQPFIFLQQKFFFLPYAQLWAAFLPIIYVVGFFKGNWRIFCHKSHALLLLVVLAAVSMGTTIDTAVSVDGLIKLFSAFLAYGIAYNIVKGPKDVDQVVKYVIWASVIPLAFGFYQELTGNFSQIHTSVTNRVNSVFGVGNAYGIFLTISMCAVMIQLLKPNLNRKVRLLYVGLFCAMVVSQILALNRGTWVALVIAILGALLPYRRKINIRWIVLGAVLISVTFSGVIIQRFTESHIRWDGTQANTFESRQKYWLALLPQIQERPILGHGIGTTGVVGDTPAPHNDYIRMAMDVGVAGGLVYAYFLVSLVFYFMTRRKTLGNFSLWRYNYPMTVLNIYFVIISATQNVTQSTINFGFFLILNGAVVRLNMMRPKTQPRVGLQKRASR